MLRLKKIEINELERYMKRTLPAELMDETAALQARITTAQVGSNRQLTIVLVYNLKQYKCLILRLALLFYAAASYFDNVTHHRP